MEETWEQIQKSWQEREEVARIARKVREEEAKTAGIRLQDAVVGKLYRITALYRGESEVFEYAGCQGSHDHVAFGVPVGATAYFKHPVFDCHYLHSTSQLEPGGRHAQWFMVPLTPEEAAAAPAEVAAARAAEKVRKEKEDRDYAAYVAGKW